MISIAVKGCNGRQVAGIAAVFPPVSAILVAGLIIAGTAGAVPVKGDDRPVVVSVVAREFRFEPREIHVSQGQSVRLTLENQGVLSHNLEIPALELVTETIQPQQTASVTFTAGQVGEELVFRCRVPGHEQAGMAGKIVITAEP